ncbi:MAG: DUF883 domain-containing protein [Steroidobacteraceae bacterium]
MSTTAESINDAADAAESTADAAIRRKASQLQKFFDDVEELLHRASSMNDSEITRLRSRVESSINHVKSAARDGVNAAVERTRGAALATDDYVHTKPWIAIGAVGVAGLLLGALLRGNGK